ncbi:MAG TPA: ATP-binding protein [Candidatus Eisenbacteria bacterium]|nr:ATP-binding protein [Candidatus Eisenbacteria bacterium]
MQRTVTFITLFAVGVVLATGISSWLAFRGVSRALASEFEVRLARGAVTAAREIGATDVAEARLRESAAGYLAVQVQLVTLRAATGVVDASLVDTAGVVLVDARDIEGAEGLATPLDSLAGGAVRRALRGAITVSRPYPRGGQILQAGLAPVRDEARRVVGAVIVEAVPAYRPIVRDLGRTLLLVALGTLLGIAVLTAFVIRNAMSAASLERRLSRAENLAAMGRLTATLAHEIKNPLAIIRGSAQRLGRLDPEAQRMAEFVVEEADRLSRTVARYLQFARGEPARGGPGDAVEALEATLALLEGECAARNVTQQRVGSFARPAPVRLDNESLKQLYLNLMLNALEAMPEGGALAVSVVERGARFEVAIHDQGPGFPVEVLRHIGDPFVTTKPTGSGLGLFLARRLAESAGGSLEIANGPHGGATCTVRLPRARGQG